MIRSLIFRTALKCNKCVRLVSNRRKIVWGYGNDNANIMLVGEAPGKEEDIRGVPFCNPKGAGRNLDEVLEHIGINRTYLFITNSCLCRPPSNDDPTKEEKQNCKHLLIQQLEIVNPKVIVGLGRHSSNTILQLAKPSGDLSLGALRNGNPYDLEINSKKIKFMATYHPAAWIYSPERKNDAYSDWTMIKKIII